VGFLKGGKPVNDNLWNVQSEGLIHGNIEK